MNWIVNDAVLQEDGKTWLAGPQASLLKTTIAPEAWNTVQLKVVYKPAGRSFYINLDPWYIGIEEAQGRLTLSKYIGGNFFAAWDIEVEKGVLSKVEVSALLSAVSITINEQTFRYKTSAPTPMTSVGLYFEPGVEFLEPEVHLNAFTPENVLAANPGGAKSLEFTVDFYDDLLLTPFTPEMLDEMFRVMARLGTSQAYWIHHGGRDNGFWEGGLLPGNMMRAFDLLGDDYLPAAVTSSHKAGLPLIGIFKPFDTAIVHYTSAPPRVAGSARALGGGVDQGFTFPSEHPELCQKRREFPRSQKRPSQITIRSRCGLPGDLAGQIEIYVSRDNATYSLYDGARTIRMDGREIAISDLAIDEEFLVLVFPPELAAQIQNTLPLLAHLRDDEGNALEFTYGITTRVDWLGEYHLAGQSQYRDFRQHGLNFDCAGHGVPNAVWNAGKWAHNLYSPSGSHNLLGLVMNANTEIPGILSEAEPAAQAWWLSQIESMLDAGVDGVEIRIINHSNIIDWNLYGFNEPLVEEYQRRYGIDIRHEEFSREKFRELRGEFFTGFLRQASALTRARGKKFHLHIEDTHQGPASEPCPMEIAMPWRQWIEEGLCDGVTLKALNVFANDTAFGREVIALCKARNIPVSFSSFIHSVFGSGEKQQILDSYLASPYDAFNVYEFATLFEFTPEGEVRVVDQNMIDWLESYEWKGKKTPEASTPM